ncbi:MAG: DUF1415 domain-containing protein [Gammaproteobacteria bacterium]|jgi:hypothetical protein|nr:DUF1415 domain-containing protein [Gammaproteobacteria bacterium]
MTDLTDPDAITASVRYWVETVVVGLNLCPFAGRELLQERIRFVVTPAATEAELLASLQAELELLDTNPAIETTLLIHPRVLQDFADYNQFLEAADDLLRATGVEGIYQLASFHPQYQFAETAADDVENYTNRSPYPMLHLLREQSLERSIANYPDTDRIPLRNMARMKRLGIARLKQLLRACFEVIDKNESK